MKEKGEITQPEINYWIYNAESKVDRPIALSGDQSNANMIHRDLITVVQNLTCSFRNEIFSEKYLDLAYIIIAQESAKKDPTVEIPPTHYEGKLKFPIDL